MAERPSQHTAFPSFLQALEIIRTSETQDETISTRLTVIEQDLAELAVIAREIAAGRADLPVGLRLVSHRPTCL